MRNVLITFQEKYALAILVPIVLLGITGCTDNRRSSIRSNDSCENGMIMEGGGCIEACNPILLASVNNAALQQAAATEPTEDEIKSAAAIWAIVIVANEEGGLDQNISPQITELLAHVPDQYPPLFQGCNDSLANGIAADIPNDMVAKNVAALIRQPGVYACNESCIPSPQMLTNSLDKLFEMAITKGLSRFTDFQEAYDIYQRIVTVSETDSLIEKARMIDSKRAQDLIDNVVGLLGAAASLGAVFSSSPTLGTVAAVASAYQISLEIGRAIKEIASCEKWRNECCVNDAPVTNPPTKCGIEQSTIDEVDCNDPVTAAEDPDCNSLPEDCGDGYDNDSSGKADCDDPVCSQAINCTMKNGTPENQDPWRCENGYDDDFDGVSDCQDIACKDHESCQKIEPDPDPESFLEDCNNGVDDDRDGAVDCDDTDCEDKSDCVGPFDGDWYGTWGPITCPPPDPNVYEGDVSFTITNNQITDWSEKQQDGSVDPTTGEMHMPPRDDMNGRTIIGKISGDTASGTIPMECLENGEFVSAVEVPFTASR